MGVKMVEKQAKTLDERLQFEEGDLHLEGNFAISLGLGKSLADDEIKKIVIGKYNGVLKYVDKKGQLKIVGNGLYSIIGLGKYAGAI